MQKLIYNIGMHENQRKIFNNKERFKVISKGRRFGLTHGFAKYIIKQMIKGISPVLWVDTMYGNIERYFKRYFEPELKKMKAEYRFRAVKNDLIIFDSICDFRSADKPENIEGFGYRLIIINEAGVVLKNKNLWLETIYPMTLDYTDSEVIIGGTPKGKYYKNEIHQFYELYQKDKEKWKQFNYSSYSNPLLDKEQIKDLEKDIPNRLIRQEIYGEFIDATDEGIINGEWWKYYKNKEYEKERIIKKIGMWDTAFKKNQENDYSCCGIFIITNIAYYLEYIYRERIEFPELKEKSIELYEEYNLNEIWIEDKASGISLIQELKRETRIPVKEIKAIQDKIEYVNAITPILKTGKVKIKEGQSWTNDFTRECEEFPYGEYDDQVDVLSKFLNEAKNTIKEYDINKIRIKKSKIKKRIT